MKKLTATLLCAVCALGLMACGGNEDTASNAENSANESTTSAASGYTYTSNGTEIVIDAEAEAIVDALGDPISYYEAASCAFDGLDKTYTYDGFTVDTYPDEDGVDRISDVILTDDTVSTAEGVSLGASAADVTAAYGDDYEDSNGSYVYKKDGMKLTFVISDDKVTSIQYATTVLD